MPKLHAYIPDGALQPEAEQALIARLTDILLEWEGANPANEAARFDGWVFLHRPEAAFVGGEPTSKPRYRILASVPEGQLDNARRAGMVAAATEAVLDAKPEGWEQDPLPVWVFTNQIPEGTRGEAGRIFRLADIATFVPGNAEAGTAHATR